MALPFSQDAFLGVFAAYNTRLWILAAALWLVTVAVAYRWIRYHAIQLKPIYALLAVHWLVTGIAYHWFYFRAINPAAAWFAGVFIVQGVLFAGMAAQSAGSQRVQGLRGSIGIALVAYGVLYPFIGLAAGLEFPRLPLFAVPCPTTIITAGALIALGAPRPLYLVPIAWAAIASSAAFALGMTADFALLPAVLALVVDAAAPALFGARVQPKIAA